jgi:signal transduction histidine kinase
VLRVGAGETVEDLAPALENTAERLDVRLFLIDEDLKVVYDSEGELSVGENYILSFTNPNLRTVDAAGSRYLHTGFDSGSGRLTLFAPPRLTQEERDATVAAGQPRYTVLLGIPEGQLATAWQELAPRLALAGAIALTVSFLVSFFISRSISGPLARITQASRQMAAGNYDVHIPIRGQDEVGRLSEAFNGMAKEVSRSQRTMKDLLANVSHELKTPLTSIQGFSQAMLEGEVTDEEHLKESSRIINEEANRMRALVDDLLLLSQLQSGQVSLEHSHVELEPLLERTVERFHWAVQSAGVELGLHLERMPAVHGDERRLEQVFSNLVENAVRHTPRGGTISISASTLRGGHVSIGVHNTGSVIPEEDLPRLFERFFQVDRARARKGGSSGLGLSIVSEIVEAHGGTVRAVSSESAGTEFIVILPGTGVAQDGARAAAPEAPKQRRPAKERQAPA